MTIERQPPKAFILGHPVKHSRSPLIHHHWLTTFGVSGSYEKIDIAPHDLIDFIKSFSSLGYVGGNVTLPHKVAVMPLCDTLTQTARRIGAVNTLWLENGRLHGDNTDSVGFLASLDQEIVGWNIEKNHTLLLLGAGGAARAILDGMVQSGVKNIIIANRGREQAEELAADFESIDVIEWSQIEQILPDASLIINTTPLGMSGQPELDLDLSAVQATTIVADVVYTPLETKLLKTAKARGLRCLGGLGMLLHQAVPGFERWFGPRPAVTPALRALIEADLNKLA